MYEDILVNNNSNSINDLDVLFDNLSSDINSFNKYVGEINRHKQTIDDAKRKIMDERTELEKAKLNFKEYLELKETEYKNKMQQADDYLALQKQNISRAEAEFKANMEKSLNELEIIKKELEMQNEKIREEKEQFESYKNIEIERIKHSQEILESDKNQFEKYKDVVTKKLELDNKNITQKCERFKEIIGEFNTNFKPIIEENKEG